MSVVRKLVLISALASGSAFAQVQVQVSASVNIPLPTIHFDARPPLVVVQPGVQVVENSDEEVFVNGGYYWTRRDGHWFRCRDDRQWRWQRVEERHVPPGLARIPPRHYKHWQRHREEVTQVGFRGPQPSERDHGRGKWKHDDRHDDDDHGDHGHGHDHGHH